MPDFYEFFAGGGMARIGLGPDWRCLFANDIDEKKATAYRANFDDAPELRVCDVAALTTAALPGVAALAWASFPCQDLSLAGNQGGLGAERSGAFWPFWRLMQGLAAEGRSPRLIVLENVYGTLTAHNGRDFLAIADALAQAGYNFGAMVIDAVHFLPQSRPRLFIVGARDGMEIPPGASSEAPEPLWHPPAIRERVSELAPEVRRRWVWWRLPAPPPRQTAFADLIDDEPQGVQWHTPAETRRLLSLMSEVNRAKVSMAQAAGRRMVGGVYKRTRNGMQRAEVRFDDVAGCLRTPVGGSSRQTILMVEGERIRSRLLSPREAARLMGLPESYALPERYNDAYYIPGDGLAVPVVRHLAENILEPMAKAREREAA
jgi:DNA (cytosine-5)-methyltransferase 1